MKKLVLALMAIMFISSAAMAAKITEYTEDTAPSSDDLVVTVNDPSGTPANRKVQLSNLFNLTYPMTLFDDADPTTDAAGEAAFDTNALASGRGCVEVFDGTSSTFLCGFLATDTWSDGDVLTVHTGGTLTLDTPSLGLTTGTDTAICFSDGTDNPVCNDTGCTYNKTTDTLSCTAFEAAASATPTIKMYDSDGTDADINGQIDGNLTDTGSGTEDFDIFVKQQIAGTLTTVLTFDADGSIIFQRATQHTTIELGHATANTLSASGGVLSIEGVALATTTQAKSDPICKTIETPADADNLMVHRMDRAATITSIYGIVEAATSAIFSIQECDTAGDNCAGIDGATTITADVDGQADDGSLSNAAVDSGDWLRLDVGTVTGTVGHLTVCVNF